MGNASSSESGDNKDALRCSNIFVGVQLVPLVLTIGKLVSEWCKEDPCDGDTLDVSEAITSKDVAWFEGVVMYADDELGLLEFPAGSVELPIMQIQKQTKKKSLLPLTRENTRVKKKVPSNISCSKESIRVTPKSLAS